MQKPSIRRKIIIDTDPGIDDALALLLILKSRQFEVQAITTVAGNATIDKVTRNAQAILDLLESDIPVFSGRPEPWKRKLSTAVVHGQSGLDGFDTGQTQFQLTGDAPQKIAETVRKFPGEVTLLTLGPLSNIARAFQLDPELPKHIPEIIMMGGAINVPGNKNRVGEFNFVVDPEAASAVFEAEVPKVLTPLDVCIEVVLQVDDFSAIKNAKLRTAILPMLHYYLAGLKSDEGTSGILVYDALAAYFLLNPSAYQLCPMHIVIETKGAHTLGMSVAEKRGYISERPNVSVVTSVDKRQFREDFFETLSQ
jgi:inosine-uridine nucleoside N-ribohydrolase